MSDAVVGQAWRERIESERADQSMVGTSWLYPVPARAVPLLLAAGTVLGLAADFLARAPGPLGLNASLWIAAVAIAAIVLHRRASVPLDLERVAWLIVGVLFAAGLSWRDAPALKVLALGCATLTFALAAYRLTASWLHRAGVVRYAVALALGALHAWLAPVLAFGDAALSFMKPGTDRVAGWRRALAVVRGLVIAAPLIAVFALLFASADVVFERLVQDVVDAVFRFDVEWIAGHVVLFSVFAWISTGYLRGFLSATEPPLFTYREKEGDEEGMRAPGLLTLGITEIATVIAAMDLLFLAFVIVQFRYLFGSDALVQITPDLTYAEYARRGFFELVVAVVLVVPILLAADWLLGRRTRTDALVFRVLAGVQIGLVVAIAASALQRLRLYHASYGLTEARFYAMVLLLWIGAMLVWFAATVLRGRRNRFAFGTLTSGLSTVALLFVINPDAMIARTNVNRATSTTPVGFDVTYATLLSADAVPVLIDALPTLPGDAQCRIARRMLDRWGPDRERSIRSWSWSTARARGAILDHESQLRSRLGAGGQCD